MMKLFLAQNFKSLRDVHVEQLSRINIIVGQSASGKSALLEAIRLALSATANTAFNIAVARGLVGFPGNVFSKEGFESLWTPLFLDFRHEAEVKFHALFDDHTSIATTVFFDAENLVNVTSNPFQPSAQNFVPFSVNPLKFHRVDRQSRESEASAGVGANGSVFFVGEDLIYNSELLPAVWQPNAIALAERFSHLSVDNEEFEIIEAVRYEFQEILGLSIQGVGQSLSVHAAIRGVRRKLPLASVSSGINKFVALLIAIKTMRGGTILIDEVENGIYWKLMPQMWKALHTFAVRYDVQLFITTHSLECINAAKKVIDSSDSDFTLLQVTRSADGTRIFSTPGENLAAALEAEIELRR